MQTEPRRGWRDVAQAAQATALSSRQHRITRLAQRNLLWNRIGYTPHAKQREGHDAIARGCRYVMSIAGRRGGKSEFWSTEALTEMAFEPIGRLPWRRVLVAAPESDITDNIFGQVWRWIVDDRVLGYEPLYKSIRERHIEMPWHSRIEGKTTDNPKSLRGPGQVMTIADEYAFGADIFTDYIEAPLIDLGGIAGIATTPNGRNHLYSLYKAWLKLMRQGDPLYHVSHWTSYDNPHLPAGAIAAIEARARASGSYDVFRQEFLAEFTALSGAVYPQFSERKHVGRFEIAKDVPITLGVDWGFRNPAAVEFGQFISGGERLLVFDEVYGSGMTSTELGKEVKRKLIKDWGVDPQNGDKFNIAYCDPSGAQDIEEWNQLGIPSTGETARGGKLNSITDGIVSVRELLAREHGPPGILIHRRCENLIRELPELHYPSEKESKVRSADEKPVKKNDHSPDGLRYMIHGETADPLLDWKDVL